LIIELKRAPLALLVIAYAAFVSLGLPDAVNGVAWPSIREHFGLPQAGLGLLVAVAALFYMASSFITPRLMGHFGVGGLLAASTGMVVAGLCGYGFFDSWISFLFCAACIGLGSGAIDTALNHYAAMHFSMRHMSWLHGFYMVGAASGPAIMTTVMVRGATFRSGYLIIAFLLSALMMTFFVTRRSWNDKSSTEEEVAASPNNAGTWEALHSPVVLWQALVFLFACALEATAGQWIFTVMKEHHHLSTAAAGQWTTAHWAMAAFGRFFLGAWAERMGAVRVLRVCLLGVLAGTLIFAFAPLPYAPYGVLLIGLGLSVLYPLLMSHTPERVGERLAPAAVGIQVAFAVLGAALFPAVAGLLAGHFGLGMVGLVIVGLALVSIFTHEQLLKLLERRSV
jgi:fucose permease